MHTHSQTHQSHTWHGPPEGPPGTDWVFWKAPWGPGCVGWARGVPRGDPPRGWPSPPRCLGWEGCSAPRRSGCSGRPCPSSCSRAASRLLGWRPLWAEHRHGAPDGGPGPARWQGCSGRPGSTTNPNKGELLRLRPSPLLPTPGVDRPEERRRTGGGRQELVLSPTLLQGLALGKSLPALSPNPPSLLLCLLLGGQGQDAAGTKAGPASGCLPARAGVATPQETCWVAPHPSPAAPHIESPFRQERSAELGLLVVYKGWGKQVAGRQCYGHHPRFLGTPTR